MIFRWLQYAAVAAFLWCCSADVGVKEDRFEDFVLGLDKDWDGPEPFDLRVAKAMGPRGYYKARVSAITFGDHDFEDFHFTFKQPFKYKWTHGYDLGSAQMACPADSVFKTMKVENDAACLEACNHAKSCAFYTYFDREKLCSLADQTCKLQKNSSATASYQNFGLRMLHSAIVDLKAGKNEFRIGGKPIEIHLPAEDSGTRGVFWADPCFSGRWVDCEYAKLWDVFHDSHELINALAYDNSVHFFHILGDNFYDQDGRLTKAIFDRFSLRAKSKFFQTTVGNHDIWVAGGPPGGRHDQYGHGFMQFYAQDTLASLHSGFFNYTIDPDQVAPGTMRNEFRNDFSNFLWYNKLGNLGFIGYTGSGTLNETLPEIAKACEFFAETKPKFIFLVGHWNEGGDGADEDMKVPTLRDKVLELEGCNIGDRFKFVDGHGHCNEVQAHGEKEPVGFLIGAHGMIDARCLPMYGFLFLDSVTDNKLRLFYFEEHSLDSHRHDEVVSCIRLHEDISKCTHLAKLWLETDIPRDDRLVSIS